MTFPFPITPTIFIPRHAAEVRATRSSGKGGQNVNKVSSKAEVHLDTRLIEGLNPRAHQRLLHLAANRLDAEGRLLTVSEAQRDFHRNLQDALEKAATLVRAALHEPKRRRKTKATKASKQRRLEGKGRRSEVKRRRRSLDD